MCVCVCACVCVCVCVCVYMCVQSCLYIVHLTCVYNVHDVYLYMYNEKLRGEPGNGRCWVDATPLSLYIRTSLFDIIATCVYVCLLLYVCCC